MPAHIERATRLRDHWNTLLLGQCTEAILSLLAPAYHNDEHVLLSVDELARKSQAYIEGQVAAPPGKFRVETTFDRSQPEVQSTAASQ